MITDSEVVNVTASTPYGLQYAALILSTIAQTAFVSMYSTVKWKRHYVGRALFGQATSLLAAFYIIGITRALEFPGEDWLRVVAYLALSMALWNQAYALWKQQHEDKVVVPEEES